MAILVRSGNEKWKSLSPSIFSNEAELQKMLYDSPELVPIKNDDEVGVFIREAGLPGSGSTDLLGVDSQGNILIVETKLAKNQEVRRKVVGQILEYGAFLWRMPFDDFDEFFIRRRSKSVLALLAEQKPGLAIDEVREAVRRNLSDGKFHLLIAVDQINTELERIISYFAECGGGIQLEALELELYSHDKTQILVPNRFGTRNDDSASIGRNKLLTMHEVLTRANGVARERLQELVDLWLSFGNRIEPGTQGASFKADIKGRLHPIFWAYPNVLQAAFGELVKRGAPEAPILDFRQVVAEFKGFDQNKVLNGAQPTAKLEELSREEIKSFVGTAQSLVLEWRDEVSRK
ncbi:MAG TPA: hypothetical protein VFP11_10290 [Candidatus Angelobacter sp.]|nr:hypothetical protein [Candidatus Angelobacter sp.]